MKLSEIVEKGKWQGDHWPIEFRLPDDDHNRFTHGRYFRGYDLGVQILTLVEDNANDPLKLGAFRKLLEVLGDLDVIIRTPDGYLAVKEVEMDPWMGRILITTRKPNSKPSIGKFTAMIDDQA